MPTSRCLFAAALCVFSTAPAKARDNDFINTAALTGEYVASNPGLEILMPYWQPFNSNTNPFNTRLFDGEKTHFDVYALTTGTKLFSTPDYFFKMYLVGVAIQDPSLSDYDKSVDFKRLGNTVVMAVKSTYKRIGTTDYMNDNAYLYAADVSKAGNTPWVKVFATDSSLKGTAIVPDMNANGTEELAVTLFTYQFVERHLPTASATVYIYDGKTGAALIKPNSYSIQPEGR